MKKRGITLIETIVSLMILMIVIPIAALLIKDYKMNLQTRIFNEQLSRISYCVMNELKYNYSIADIRLKAHSGEIRIENSDGLLEELCYKGLFDIQEGDGINILINDSGKEYLDITIIVNDFSGEYSVERMFTKWR